ncbi:v-cath [Cyclophragma undans nucleopolyhedrovirus]|uniref:Viral cathepsin n=1 Tax=Cyclophragma undans nucleopolyhedrovirus TaxID=1906244 RepID=A0A288QZP2_9ABAC|nr:v-cath [Cyclophragma undans nucleopolyhedrovirus]AOT85582.1 v-cath [Cyclophragma undans nucleopolyhedrovirus]
MLKLLYCIVLLSGPAAFSYDLLQAPNYFEDFLRNYNKKYESPVEKQHRFKIFEHNLREIIDKNRLDGGSAQYKINKFSDLSKNEILTKYTGLSVPPLVQNFCRVIVLDQPPGKGPLNFDWRDQNKVTNVKNQGACGACWAFATLASLETQYALKFNRLVNLSEQQLIDCDYVDLGCMGGLLHTAYEQMMTMGGVQLEQDYPYAAADRQCNMNPNKFMVAVRNCSRYIVYNEEKLKDVLRAAGPVPVAIDAADIVEYDRGVMRFCSNSGLNHAVLLVGYGVQDDGVPFWTFKNSWGDDWGEQGYFRVRQNVNACGMRNDLASTATIY